ncbi:MAG: hypothetical protein JSS72_01750 [Armatimonadetes bacterium]|nr:hypothetical protein [Armatimonadota bacterium]
MIESEPFALSRTQLAYAAGWLYVRLFWPILLAVPSFGVALLVFGSKDPVLRYFGLVCFLWPFSIPARAVMNTTKTIRLLGHETRVQIGEGELRFLGESGKGLKLSKKSIWRFTTSLNFYALVTRKFQIAFVPKSALPTIENTAQLEQALGV